MLRCTFGVFTFMWNHTRILNDVSYDNPLCIISNVVVLEAQDLKWRIRCFSKFRSFDVQSQWSLGLLEITSRRKARSEKKELGKTSVGMRWSFRKRFLVRNDVFAIAKYKNWKKLGVPTALLTLPHEAFEDGMYQNTVNNGVWIHNRIKVTLK